MAKPISLRITCPRCRQNTKLTAFVYLQGEEYEKELKRFSYDKSDMITPEFTKQGYEELGGDKIQKDEYIDIVLAKIGSHKIGLFKEECYNSNKAFKVAYYGLVNHKEKTAGFTFRIGEEIKYPLEMLTFAEQISKYCSTLGKESISIVLNLTSNKKFTLTGDANSIFYLSPELRMPFQCIAFDSTMSPKELKEFIIELRDKLEANNETVKAVIKDNTLFTIQCFKNSNWYECVAITTKGYHIT